MARQEVTSVFSDGLMMDLNPINTPKSVLTDCLNGTFITYNGNEFVLQNDMGNYKLQNCKLPTNFIPVGVKGYADILYIVSYNPITKEVEIGSYPAPQSIFQISDDNQDGVSDTGIIQFELTTNPDTDIYKTTYTWNKKNVLYNWTYDDLITKQRRQLYTFIDDDEEAYKLYPGDEFQIIGSNDDNLKFTFQHLDWFIIDEDNKLYDIEDSIIEKATFDTENPENYKKVSWEVPGWLAAQYNLSVPDTFNLNLRNLEVPTFLYQKTGSGTEDVFNVKLYLNAQVTISDKLFIEQLNQKQRENLYIRFKYNISNASASKNLSFETTQSSQEPTGLNINANTERWIDVLCNYHNYQDDILTAYVNGIVTWTIANPLDGGIIPLNWKCNVSCTAYPIIVESYNLNGETYYQVLEYTQFSSTLSFDLDNLQSPNDIHIGESIYKFSTDDNSCTVSFDIDGPFINTFNYRGYYNIYALSYFNGHFSKGYSVSGEQEIPNLNLLGQNTLDLDFSKNKIQVENIYILELIIKDRSENNKTLVSKSFILITSKAFNDYFGSVDNYNTIYLDQWVPNYLNYVILEKCNILSITPNKKQSDNPDYIVLQNGQKEYNITADTKNDDMMYIFDNKTSIKDVTYYTTSKEDRGPIIVKLSFADFIDSITLDQEVVWDNLKGALWNNIDYDVLYKLGNIDLTEDNTTNTYTIPDSQIGEYQVQYSSKDVTGNLNEEAKALFNNIKSVTIDVSEPGGALSNHVEVAIGNSPVRSYEPNTISGPGENSSSELVNSFRPTETAYATLSVEGFIHGENSLGWQATIAPSLNVLNPGSESDLQGSNAILVGETANISGVIMRSNIAYSNGTTALVYIKGISSELLRDIKYYPERENNTYYLYLINGTFNNLPSEINQSFSSIKLTYVINELSYLGRPYYQNESFEAFPLDGSLQLCGASNLLGVSSNPKVSLQKVFYSNISSLTLTMDLLTLNTGYKQLYTNINQWINNYNSEVNSKEQEMTNSGKAGLAEGGDEKIKKQLTSSNGSAINPDNVCWKISNTNWYLWAYNSWYGSTRPRDRSAFVALCRYDEFTSNG